jgi:hypothetical protein
MSVLNEIAAQLETLSLGTVGTSIHIGRMPETNASSSGTPMCAVYEYPGIPSDLGFGVAGVQHEYPGVQVVFRGWPNDYATPRAKAATCHQSLPATQGTTLSGTKYLTINPTGSPVVIKRDAEERVYIGVSFIARKEPS